jgi:hypothetical protein
MSVELTPAEIEYILWALALADSNVEGPRSAAARRLSRSLAEKLRIELDLQAGEMAGEALTPI